MHPYFNLFGHVLPAYSAAGLAGFVAGILYLARICRHRDRDMDFDDALYLYVAAFLGMLAGAKILYIALNIPEVVTALRMQGLPLLRKVWLILRGGMVFYGGLFGAVAGAALAARYFGFPVRQRLNTMTPLIPLVAGFGRIGCFLVGCCYGRVTTARYGLIFAHSESGPRDVYLIPTQLYEAAFQFLMFIVMDRICARKRTFDPVVLYFGCYAVFRFILEFFRGDEIRGIWAGLSTSQWISLVTAAVCAYLMRRRRLSPDRPLSDSSSS